ncbi:hypothetical protein [Paraburkholderia unamae]|uniref:Uncharacterized protein n=1 Tax=Paraburkholderia unamae TaxID=219649 RepID=A0ACC6RXR2_9BURK
MPTKISEALVERAMECVRDGKTRTYRELADALKVTIMSGHKVIETLHERHQIYVKDFRRSTRNGKLTPAYALGSEPDAQSAEYEQQRNVNRACQVRSKVDDPHRSWLDIALFGDAPPLANPTNWKGRIVRQSMSLNDEDEVAA